MIQTENGNREIRNNRRLESTGITYRSTVQLSKCHFDEQSVVCEEERRGERGRRGKKSRGVDFVQADPAAAECLAAHVSRCRKTSGQQQEESTWSCGLQQPRPTLWFTSFPASSVFPFPFSRLLSDPISRPEWPGRGPVASFRRCSLPVKLLDCSRLSGPPHLLCPQSPPNSFSGLRRMFGDLRRRCSPILPSRLRRHR